MKIETMKLFRDLVDSSSFSRTADMHGVSQPAVSQQLAKLEQILGTQLISRGGGLLAPSEAGKVFYGRAGEIIRIYEQMLGEVRSAADAIRGVLRVGTIYSVGFYLLNPCIRRFIQAHPEVDLRIDYTHWSRIYAAVLSGEMDLGVVAYPDKQRNVEIIPFASEDLVVACSPEHRLAAKKKIKPADLKGERFVAFEASIPTRRHIDQMLKSHRVDVDVVMEFDNIEILKRAVEVNAGLSILPIDNIEREVADGRLCGIPFTEQKEWVRPLGVLRRRGKSPGPAERMFLRLIRNL